MASTQFNTGEQEASFEEGAPGCGNTRRKTKFKSKSRSVVGPFKAYICAAEWSKAHGYCEDDAGEAKVSPEEARRQAAKEARQKSRAEDLANGIMQYVVKVPIEDDGAKSMLWDIGQSAISNSLLYEAVKAVEANESLQEIVTSVVKTRGFGHLLVELSDREDLREFTEDVAANDEHLSLFSAVAADPVLQEIIRAVQTAPGLAGLLLEITRRGDLRALTESTASDSKLLSTALAVVADASLRQIVRSASTAPGLTVLLLEITRRDDLRKLTEVLSKDSALADALSDLAGAEEDLVRSMAEIIGKANRVTTDGQTCSLVTDAVRAALGDPEATIKTAAIRQAGGVRARILTWLLNVG